MKAIIWTKYGPPEVLQLEEVQKPTPKSNELRIKVHTSNVFTGDCEMRRSQIHPSMWLPIRIFMGIFRPRIKILGQELSGIVEAVGENVSTFKAGDAVIACTGFRFGSYAEYLCLPDNYAIAMKPANISHEEAATLPVGGIHALHFLRAGGLAKGEKILIFGAGGCIGTYAVQIAHNLGAEVTVVDSADKLEMLLGIGADHAIDFRQQDFTQMDTRYDVIFDVVGKSPYARSLRSLKPTGRYLLANSGLSVMLRGWWSSRRGAKKVLFSMANITANDLEYLIEMVSHGKLKAVIDRTYPLDQMTEAHRYIDSGKKQGHVVVRVADDEVGT